MQQFLKFIPIALAKQTFLRIINYEFSGKLLAMNYRSMIIAMTLLMTVSCKTPPLTTTCLKKLKLLHTLPGHTSFISSVTWSPDGKRIASGSDDKTVKVWDVARGKLIHTLHGHKVRVTSVAWSPDGERIATGCGKLGLLGNTRGGNVTVWDATSGKALFTLQEQAGFVNSVVWSPDGKRIASGVGKISLFGNKYIGYVRVFDVASGELLHTLRGNSHCVQSVAWSPDGKRLVSGNDYGSTLEVWDVANEKVLHTLQGHTSTLSSVAWSLDGKRLASCGSGGFEKPGLVEVWDSASGKSLRTLRHDKPVASVAWSPDGKYIASGTGPEDNAIRLWDADSGQLLHTLRGHSGWVLGVAWCPDGMRIASGSEDKTVKVWTVAK